MIFFHCLAHVSFVVLLWNSLESLIKVVLRESDVKAVCSLIKCTSCQTVKPHWILVVLLVCFTQLWLIAWSVDQLQCILAVNGLWKFLRILNSTLNLIKVQKMAISSDIFTLNIFFFIFERVHQVFRSFTGLIFRKIWFASDFNGSLGHLCGNITH